MHLRLLVRKYLSFIWSAVVFRSDSSSTEKVNDSLRASSIEDSDLDVEESMPSIERLLTKDALRKMKPKEKKLHEVVNGRCDQCVSSVSVSGLEWCSFKSISNFLDSISRKKLLDCLDWKGHQTVSSVSHSSCGSAILTF